MKRVLKFIGLALAGIASLALVAFAVIYFKTEAKRNSKVEVSIAPIEIPTDATSLAEGQRQVQVKGCADCHGSDLGGKTFVNEPPIGQYSGSNLTPGKGSVTSQYQDVDWIRSIRFGVHPQGRPLVFMPAGDFHGISNEELGKMIAYLKTLQPVDRESLPQKIGPVARILYGMGQMPLLFSIEEIDLNAKPIEKVEPGLTPEFGQYLSQGCTGCHGPGFSGGQIPGTPPSWPAAKNLTPSGRMANWTLADFEKVLRQGLTPDGHQIDPQFMPWKATQAMTSLEVQALFQFLKSLPARTEGTR